MKDKILLTGRLLAEEAADILGFKKHDIPILMRARLLKAPGNPARNAVKHFAAVEIDQLAHDADWLSKASKAIYNYWSGHNRTRRRRGEPPEAAAQVA